ncbi:hypothetical protein [Collimonas pratensis]|uniref:Uncharacterized protein n=1 Tax=Collimonas pratensis TaxID=279113 RepID=A0ABN4MDM1_9BURK|nr:hypothetical protein [Collimonas pratensis]AMP15913.1 hypothetical protein CPter291_3679 [Collimonas pratensis]NKI70190.1 hypothetical protein [Collimonas pratensis]
MRNSLENRIFARIENSVGNDRPAAEAVRDASTRLLAPDGKPAEAEEAACGDTAVMAASVDAESISHPMPAGAGAGSSQFPMTGAGLANIRNEL